MSTISNRLSGETSPYLLQHASNPVNWFPWGDEAFAKAKEEDKLILVSIGYSSCHWCHVMEKEAFSDKEVAALKRRGFVAAAGPLGIGVGQDEFAVFSPEHIKSADAATYDDNGDLIPLSRRFDDARADIRFKLPGVTLDDDISAPVRVGELRTQAQLENDDPVGFPILDHIRGGSRIIIDGTVITFF